MFHHLSLCLPSAYKSFLLKRTSTGCPNKFRISSKLLASEASIVCKKIVLCSKKLLFQPFLWTARKDSGFLSHFSPISDNLLNKLLHKIIGEKCLKIPFSFLQFAKNAEKGIFWCRIHFFVKFVIFAGKLLSFRILH